MKNGISAIVKQVDAARVLSECAREQIENQLEQFVLRHDMQVNLVLLKKLVFKYSQAERELDKLNKLKNKFLGMAAHDLRNPISSIRGFSEILLDDSTGPLNADQRECLEIIHQTSQGMLNLVNELLDVSVIESGKLNLDLQPYEISQIIENRVRLNEIAAQKKGTRLHLELKWKGEVVLDEGKINQVIDNLVSNAVKYSPPESDIHIICEEVEEGVKISVKDQGPGISPEDRKKLFGEFQKLSARPTAGEKSTGLGLSITKKIVEAHLGKIDVVSDSGMGSTFFFILPLSVAKS